MHASWILWVRVRAMAVMWGWLWPWMSLKTAMSSFISSTVGVLMLRMALATIQAPPWLLILPAFTCSMRKAMQGLVAVMETRSRKSRRWRALISAGTLDSILVFRSLMSSSPRLARVLTMIKAELAASSCSKELSGDLLAFVRILRKIRITFSLASSTVCRLDVKVVGALTMSGMGTWGLNHSAEEDENPEEEEEEDWLTLDFRDLTELRVSSEGNSNMRVAWSSRRAWRASCLPSWRAPG